MTSILVTNDDGISAPGIQALSTAMTELGDVLIAAPATNQSASGHKKTLFQDIPVLRTTLSNGLDGVAVTGSPADCVAVIHLGLVDFKPDIVVSGINRGANMGQDLTYSGTVSGALEATVWGTPGVAVSLDNPIANEVSDYARSAEIAVSVVQQVLLHGLPDFTILSVNVPKGNDVKKMYITRQGIRIYRDVLEYNGDSVRIVGDPPTGVTDVIGTDIWAVHNGFASLTPVHLDLTSHRFQSKLYAWNVEI